MTNIRAFLKPCAICMFIFVITACTAQEDPLLIPEQVMMKYLTDQVAEDQLMDPLIVAGPDVVPLVLSEVIKKAGTDLISSN